MLFGLVKGAVKGTLLLAAVAAAGLSYGYYRLAASKLVANEGAVITAGVTRATPSLSGGTLPVTFEAYVKEPKGQNFLSTGGSAGLVRARYEWSHGGFAWVEDVPFAERQAEAVKERRRLAARDVGTLIKDLRSDDPIKREIASKELLIRTGQTQGYAYDAPAAEREKAIQLWETWWANDDNRLRYGAKRMIDGMDSALDTLRRALDEKKPAEGGAK